MTTADLSPEATPTRRVPDAQAFIEMQASPEFQDLRRRLRRFVFPTTAFFLTWYAVYVLLATYAHDFMSHKLFGNINVALVLGLGQFVTTFAITWAYVRFANRTIDPMATDLRQSIEADLKGDGGDVALGKGEPK